MVEKLGEILVKSKRLNPRQLEIALHECEKTGEFLGSTLLKLGFLKEKDLLSGLSEQFNIPYRTLRDLDIDPQVIKKVPQDLVLHYKFMPIELGGDTLTIAIANPLDVWPAEDIRLHLGFKVKAVLACEDEIQQAIKKYYRGLGETVAGLISPQEKTNQLYVKEADGASAKAPNNKAARLAEQFFEGVVKQRASDVHIEVYAQRLRVRYRIDDILYEMPLTQEFRRLYPDIISHLKNISGLSLSETLQPQDGRLKIYVHDKAVELRISILPTPSGEHIVIKVLSIPASFELKDLGFLDSDIKLLTSIFKRPHGIILATGPRGSGKTTSLYAMLNYLNQAHSKIITIQDHIEYELPGVTQVQVDSRQSQYYAETLKRILWHDPDVIMVSDIGSFEAARLVINFSLSGHLVFSSLETKDAPSCVLRLIEMGIEPYLIASSLEAVVSQRLVRTICPDCKEKDNSYKFLPSQELLKDKVFRGRGCEHCRFTGYRGRSAIYEILTISEEIKGMILNKATAGQIKHKAQGLGLRTIWKNGWDKIALGLTTPEELMRVAPDEAHFKE